MWVMGGFRTFSLRPDLPVKEENHAQINSGHDDLATAAYQEVEEAVADGNASTLGPGEEVLGCFEDPSKGGMGVHYLKASLLDATLDPKAPEPWSSSSTTTARSPNWWPTNTSSQSPPVFGL